MSVTNKYARLPLSSITIDRENRQRREIQTEDLEESIRHRGVLQPILVTQSGKLLVGERRFTASQKLGLPDIPVRFVRDETSPIELEMIELEENVRRKDLPWEDRARAVLRMFNAHITLNPGHTQVDFAKAYGWSVANIHREIEAGKALVSQAPGIAAAKSREQALNIIQRRQDREVQNVVADLVDSISSPAEKEGIEVKSTRPPEDDIICQSFLDWAPSYTGPKFNLLHCDFPYGIDLQDSDQAGAGGRETYEDQAEVYWKLLTCLGDNWDRLMSQSAHILFWYSDKFRFQTEAFFSTSLPWVQFSPYPLIWHKTDNKGIVSDVTRYPRHIYETCLFGRVGDRKTVKLISDVYGAPKANSDHVSEKPEPMLRHFFGACVDTNTRLLDPTCGSGASLRAAESLGATRVLGLEINPEYCESARARLRQSRSLKLLADSK